MLSFMSKKNGNSLPWDNLNYRIYFQGKNIIYRYVAGTIYIPRTQSSIPHDQIKEGILNLFLGKWPHRRALQILDQREMASYP